MSIGTVETEFGKVSGVEMTGAFSGITYFKGIPFAAPPVGELRWRPPVDPEKWSGVRRCDTFAKMAPQIFPPMEKFNPYGLDFYWNGYPEADEDCLYLNVCTGAQSSEENRPVYIWFHGGGLSTGFSYEFEFSPEVLSKKGIVVVQAAQRLNVLGYICLPQLTKEQGCVSGNYGLMDQLQVLKWVKNNIRGFGGDPDNITIGGQSGGSTKTCVMAAIPSTAGMIKRVINESGLKWKLNITSPDLLMEKSRKYLQKIGIDPDLSPAELRKIPAGDLVDGSNDMPEEMVQDGRLIPGASVDELMKIYPQKLDFLCGSNFGEMSPEEIFGRDVSNSSEFYSAAREMLGDLFDQYHFEQLFPVRDENWRKEAMRLGCLGLTRFNRRGMGRNLMLARVFGMKNAKANGGRTYVYLMSHYPPCRPEEKGTERDEENLLAYHSSEMWYVFYSLRSGIPPVRPWREVDYQVAEMASSYWANFIATGDVNGEGLPYWPAASENYGWMEILPSPVAREGIDSKADQMLREHVRRTFGE